MIFEVDIKSIKPWISDEELNNFLLQATEALEELHGGTGEGNDFLGWLALPNEAGRQADEINRAASDFRKGKGCIVVIGIGGSYLGAKAVIDALSPAFGKDRPGPEICFAGHHLSEDYLYELLEYLDTKDWGIVVISKSGTTTEPAIAFRLLNSALKKKYGSIEAAKRVIAITDAGKGALRTMASRQDYRSFVIPDNIGGRYSVLTPVGLVPIALAGFDITEMINGALDVSLSSGPGEKDKQNPALLYAAARNALLSKGKNIEILANFNPRLHYVSEWWKQLFGESEGKDNKGIFPASVDLTTDLHSLGQYIQDGPRNLFETFMTIESAKNTVRVTDDEADLDQLNYISGMRVEEINRQAALGTMLAHVDGGVPAIQIKMKQLGEKELGALFYFFELACGISGYMLGVNPFDQPGVEAYKTNMFALLGKPGFEEQTRILRNRLKN